MLHQILHQSAPVTVFAKDVAESVIVCWLKQSYHVVIIWLLYLGIDKLAYVRAGPHLSPYRHLSLGCLVRLLGSDFLQSEESIWAALDLLDQVDVCEGSL